MIEASSVAEALGGKEVFGSDVDSEIGLVQAIEDGLPVAAVAHIIKSGLLSSDEVFHHVLPRRTYGRRKKARRLSPAESDRLARIARIVAFANDVFGDPRKAHKWLRRPNRVLGGRVPLDLVDSDVGVRLVETILLRIQHGVYS